MHPSVDLRRLRYGSGAQLNLSVEVQDHDLKPVLYVSLEDAPSGQVEQEGQLINTQYLRWLGAHAAANKSRQNFYACDGGCLDAPVQLR